MKNLFTFFTLLFVLSLTSQTGSVPGVPYFYQYNNSINPGGSCQNTSIAMVIKFYGGTAETPDAISGVFGTSQAQTPSGLKQVFDSEAAYFGLTVRDIPHTSGTFAGIHALLAAGKPVIVHGYFTSYGHVMVITGYNGTTYTCNDPAGQWSQVYQYGGYSQTNSTEGHSITYSKSNFENAIGPDGTVWYHEFVNTGIITPPPSTLDITPPTSVANVINPATYKTTNFTVNFTDTDNSGGSGLEKSLYSVLDWNGTEWRGNTNNGFLCDNFDNTIHTDWTVNAGTWGISNNVLNQTDNVNTNTAFNTTLNQALSNRYIYHWQGNIGGTGTNRNAGIHIMSDNVNNVNRGNNYLIWFKADAGEIHIYEIVNDVIGTPLKVFTGITINTNTWYDNKIMYDRTTGKFTIWMNDDLIGTYTDTTPLMTGNGFSFRTRECTYNINNLKIYRSRLATSAVVSIGSATADVRYQSPDSSNISYSCKIKTLCVDNVANVSAVGDLNVLVDWTAPSSPVTLNDGTGVDISVTTSNTSLSANFTACVDSNSAIKRYYYFIGTAPNDSSVVGATNNGLSTSITKTGLTLLNGTTYYVSVYSLNNAGIQSAITSSNGQMVNSIATAVIETVNTTDLNVYPNPNNGLFTVLVNNTTALYTIHITNVLGELIDKKVMTSYKFEYTSQLAPGVYIITLVNENKTIATRKIIVH
ncbi:MAG: C39 family peptidase [Burkholderiales bacterium]|nr:C39 family peptidase [Bacteroidia bacterium]